MDFFAVSVFLVPAIKGFFFGRIIPKSFSAFNFISPSGFFLISSTIFLGIGLGFIAWTVQIYTESQQIITNVSLIGIGSIVFGTVLLMTAIILFSLVTIVKEKNGS